jgi:SAM-dependent methyltransferase
VSEYAALILPATNRVYAEAAVGLLRAELEVLGQTVLGARLRDLGERRIGAVPYVVFSAEWLGERDLAYLANLSSLYALFQVEGELLRPLELWPLDQFPSDLVTIQRYQGKTNEHFTKLLLNLTALGSDFAEGMLERRLDVLDPLCGRGTTLNQALMYGYNAAGIEVDAHDFDAYATFIGTWLKNRRIKHKLEVRTVRRSHRTIGRRLDVTLGATRERYKAGDTLRLSMVNADTRQGLEFFRPNSFDLVVTDAPYGVQHGSRAAAGLQRSPLDLLRAALPAWLALLRPGGAVGISWNTRVARREQAAEALQAAGLEVLDGGAWSGFRHRVDQAIVRDVLVARRR